jgi:hypothetical protein
VELSKDGSVDLVSTRSGRRRTTEITQTLQISVNELSHVVQTCRIEEHLHGTEGEYTDQQRLLLPRQLQPSHHRHRQDNDRQVGDNIENGIGEPRRECVDTLALRRWPPKLLNRGTDKDGGEHSGDGIRNDDNDECPRP